MDPNYKAKTPEEKQALSRRRIFFGLVGVAVVLTLLLIWAIIELFF